MAAISKTLLVEEQKTYELEISLKKTYNLTVDLYSAASDTVSFTDDNGAQTVTTDATGKATGVNITITQPSQGVNPTITFTSSVAKNPNNLSKAYSKTVTLTENTSKIYVMPVKAVYWWGWKDNLENCTTANGWTAESGYTTSNPTYSTYDINFPEPGYHVLCGVGSKASYNATSVHLIGKSKKGDSWALRLYANSTKSTEGSHLAKLTSTSIQYIHADITNGSYYAIAVTFNDGGQNEYLYALWFE